MYSKIETAVSLVNQEYMQDFALTKENRTADLQEKQHLFCIRPRKKEKASIRDIMNYSAAFLNGSCCKICIIQDLETGTAIPKQTWMQHSCT